MCLMCLMWKAQTDPCHDEVYTNIVTKDSDNYLHLQNILASLRKGDEGWSKELHSNTIKDLERGITHPSHSPTIEMSVQVL